MDPSGGEERVTGIEGQPAGVGHEGLVRNRRWSRRALGKRSSHRAEGSSDLGVGDAVEDSDQFDDVTATTGGEAVPEVSAAVGDERRGVVAAVYGAWADESMTSSFQARGQSPSLQHLLDRDETSQLAELHSTRES